MTPEAKFQQGLEHFRNANYMAARLRYHYPVLYVGTNGSGLYRSTDAGATWTAVPLKAAPTRNP